MELPEANLKPAKTKLKKKDYATDPEHIKGCESFGLDPQKTTPLKLQAAVNNALISIGMGTWY